MVLKLTKILKPKDGTEINILTNDVKPEQRKCDLNMINKLFKQMGLL